MTLLGLCKTIVQQKNQLLLHRVVIASSHTSLPRLAPFGVYPFVQRHAHGVHLVDLPVEVCFEVSMRAQRLLDVTCAAVLGVQLDGLEVCDVVCSWTNVNIAS